MSKLEKKRYQKNNTDDFLIKRNTVVTLGCQVRSTSSSSGQGFTKGFLGRSKRGALVKNGRLSVRVPLLVRSGFRVDDVSGTWGVGWSDTQATGSMVATPKGVVRRVYVLLKGVFPVKTRKKYIRRIIPMIFVLIKRNTVLTLRCQVRSKSSCSGVGSTQRCQGRSKRGSS